MLAQRWATTITAKMDQTRPPDAASPANRPRLEQIGSSPCFCCASTRLDGHSSAQARSATLGEEGRLHEVTERARLGNPLRIPPRLLDPPGGSRASCATRPSSKLHAESTQERREPSKRAPEAGSDSAQGAERMARAKRNATRQQKKIGSAVEQLRAHLGGVTRLDELREFPARAPSQRASLPTCGELGRRE